MPGLMLEQLHAEADHLLILPDDGVVILDKPDAPEFGPEFVPGLFDATEGFGFDDVGMRLSTSW